ncbi:XF1762 family protein [Streptomyces tendae]|uniref:XF1762 family protein n=1 Tax=Streptomyces tendae TaxID=1932 RepID=UPI003716A7A2
MNGARLHLVPVRSREAKDFVRAWHRHHPPPAGQIFAVGAADECGTLRAVAIVGRPWPATSATAPSSCMTPRSRLSR